jgi:hypothetical protein
MKWFEFFLIGITMAAIMLSGCASIITGTKQTINVQCEPEDSKIYINGAVHRSPCSQDLERGIKASSKNKITAEKDGYKPCEFNTSGGLHPWFLGNILIGGLIGMAIDLGTGAVSSIQEGDVKMVLYEDKPCDVYYRTRHGDNEKWVKYGEKEASLPKEQPPPQSKEDAFKNVKTGTPQPLK